NGTTAPAKRIVVIGGGLVGSETALHLSENGHAVTIVEMLPQIMSDVAVTDMLSYSERFAKTDLDVLTSTVVEEVTDGGVKVSGPTGTQLLEADQVVVAVGFKSEQDLHGQLAAAGQEAYLVGDAVAPGKIMDAIHTAYRLALRL
ncbi:MAG: NAD(P)/FAD-dependent oxidoreductase, partial [Bifidobacteriaceae bacterium]|nr:NAD(P)/FAD-dependent oxidoreductase [Bifidobacteriaceae bacterium]